MMLARPLIDEKSERGLDIPHLMCHYHWATLEGPFRRYLITIEEARSQAYWIAQACDSCETPAYRRF